ncbi:MAG: PQQ-binding-like beta-propeller repeat protein [bacterium]
MSLLFLGFFIVFSCSLFADTYDSQRYHFHVDLLEDWQFVETVNDKSISFIHPEGIATINITAFFFTEPVTANGLQQKRMGSHYDGWVNLFERPATDSELEQANVYDAYRALYSKHLLQSDVDFIEFIVAEFYFSHDNNSYVVSLETPKNKFSTVQVDLQKILDTFWVGKVRRVFKKDTATLYTDWPMYGQNAQNQAFVRVEPQVNHLLVQQWSTFLPVSENYLETFSPVIGDDYLFFVFQDKVYAYSMLDGVLLWSYDLQSVQANSLLYSQGILFLVQQNPYKLVALLAKEGNILYEKTLTGPVSPLVYDAGALFLVDGGVFKQFRFDTGHIMYDLSSEKFLHTYPPVVSRNQVLLVSSGQDTLCLVDTDRRELRWRKRFQGPVLYAPMIAGDLFVVLNSLPMEEDISQSIVQAFSLETGIPRWTFQKETVPLQFPLQPALSLDGLLLPYSYTVLDQQSDVLSYIDLLSGRVLWQKASDFSGVEQRALLSSKFGYMPNQLPYTMSVFDLLTGDVFTASVDRESFSEEDVFFMLPKSFFLYKKSVLYVAQSEKGLALLCFE